MTNHGMLMINEKNTIVVDAGNPLLILADVARMITTDKGTHPRIKEFGIGIRKYIGRMITSDITNKLLAEVKREIGIWFPNNSGSIGLEIKENSDTNKIELLVTLDSKSITIILG